MKIFFATFGCKVNTCEDQYYLSLLIDKGFMEADSSDDADIVVINTCAVTKAAAKKSASYISKVKNNKPHLKIVVTGCLAEDAGEKLKKYGADVVVSNGSKDNLVEHIINLSDGFISADNGMFSGGALKYKTKSKTRAFFKIQDGCDAFCSYCIIPKLRGIPKSMPLEKAVSGFKSLLDLGYKEIVLTGIHIGLYGKDLGYSFTDLLQELLLIDRDFRIRLTSIEVNEINDRLLSLMKNNNKICRHLHIPLQSGSNNILKLMNRKYKREDYINTVKKARSLIDDITIGSDIIAGFPNESIDDFNDTINCLDISGTEFYHPFAYSKRHGTKAYEMDNQIDTKEKERRSTILREKGKTACINKYKNSIGKTYRLLSEKGNKGHTDNYLLVHYKENIEPNRFINIEITEFKDNKLYGRLID